MAEHRGVSSVLHFLSPCVSKNWCLAVAPEGDFLQWATVEDSSQGPLLKGRGRKETLSEALEETHGVPRGSTYVVSVLPSLSTICRSLQLPPLKPKEIRAAVLDSLEQSMASGIDENEITYEMTGEHEGSLEITAYIARTSVVNEHVEAVRAAALEPEWVVPRAPCLARFLSHFGLQGWQYVLDIGEAESSCALIRDGRVIESRAFAGGQLALDPAGPELLMKQFLQHLMATVVAYKDRYLLDDEVLLTVTGHVSLQTAQTVADFLHTPLSPLHEVEDTTTLPFAVAIGAALLVRPQMHDVHVPNFRQGQFASPMLHLKRPLWAVVLACCALAAIACTYGHIRANRIGDAMKADWESIAQCARMTPQEIAQQQAVSLPGRPEDFVEQGEWLLSQLERRSLFPLQPNIPKVGDVITWLSNQMEEAKRSSSLPREHISLRLLHYTLVKRPSKQHPKEKYKVRVDIELETPSVVLARTFHERLLAPNGYIDGSSDVTWTTVQDRYRASFFLKDKTVYFQVDS